MKSRILSKTGITLSKGGITSERFTPQRQEKLPSTLGISLENGIPKGMRMMCVDSTNGCPPGWSMVTGVDGYHLRITTTESECDDTNSADGLGHSHAINSDSTTGGGVYANGNVSPTNGATPTIRYPAIKYLLCEKL